MLLFIQQVGGNNTMNAAACMSTFYNITGVFFKPWRIHCIMKKKKNCMSFCGKTELYL
jgi:hypothetical protein